jgi:hypothetical protein
MFEYNEQTKLCCVTYKDKYSAGEKAINDLNISFKNNIFAAGMKRLKSFTKGDYIIICADENKKKLCFLARIVEKVEIKLPDWKSQGGKYWDYNFKIVSLSKITEVTTKTSKREKINLIAQNLGLNGNNLFNMRFCSEKLLKALKEIVDQGLLRVLKN